MINEMSKLIYFLLFVSRLISSIYTYNFMTIIDFCTYDEHRKRTCIVDSSNISFVPAHNLPNVSRQMIDTYPVSSPFKYSSDIAKYFRSLVVFHLLEYVDFIPVVWISQVKLGRTDPRPSRTRATHHCILNHSRAIYHYQCLYGMIQHEMWSV